MSIDLSRLSAKELDNLISKARSRMAALKKRKPIATVRGKLTALAKAEGYTIAELFGSAAAATSPAPRKAATRGKSTGKVAPKYRNPDNPKETWTGRGMQPRWLAAQVRRGKSPTDFLISATLTPKPHKPGKRLVKASEA
jgi:DNA-binding protein H-NS